MRSRRGAVAIGVVALLVLLIASSAHAKRQPDLRYRGIQVQPRALIGHHLTITDRVKNAGSRRASRVSYSTYWFSSDRRRSADDQLVGGRRVGKLGRGKSSNATTSHWLRAEEIEAGDYFLVACADAPKRLSERREDNNCLSTAERIVVRPAQPPPVLKATPAFHDFGEVATGTTSEPVELVFENTGGSSTGPIDQVGAGYGVDVAQDSCSGLRVAPGATCSIAVTFSPPGTGRYAAYPSVGGFIPLFDAPFNRVVGDMYVVGAGVTPAELVVDFERRYFSATAGSSTWDWDIEVTNEGQAASGELSTVLAGVDADQFNVDEDNCAGSELAGGATCVVKLIYAPDAPGVASAELSVTGDPGGAAETLLSGEASNPGDLEVTPQKLDFGDEAVGSSAPPQLLTVTNAGLEPTDLLRVSTYRGDFGEFTTEGADTCTGTSLQPGLSCVFEVAFKPAVLGRRDSYTGLSERGTDTILRIWLKGRGV